MFLPLLAVSGVWRKNKLDIWRGAAGKLTKNAGKSWIEPAAADWHKSEKYKIQCWRLNCLDDSWLVKEWPDAWGRLSKLIKYQMHQIESHTAKLDLTRTWNDDNEARWCLSTFNHSFFSLRLKSTFVFRFFLPPRRVGQPPQPLDRLCQCPQEEEALLEISTPRTRERIRF